MFRIAEAMPKGCMRGCSHGLTLDESEEEGHANHSCLILDHGGYSNSKCGQWAFACAMNRESRAGPGGYGYNPGAWLSYN